VTNEPHNPPRALPERHISNIALIGFMGSGKSTVGRMLAEQLRFTLVDTDHEIERRAGKAVADIFEQSGEAAFRQLEAELVKELATRSQLVISTGGGLPVNPDNLDSLKQHSLIVCLWASPEKIWERVRYNSHRPLLNTVNPQEQIRTLLAAREPFYRRADVLVNTELRSSKEVAHQILGHFRSPNR
jgi:shikimate kinase